MYITYGKNKRGNILRLYSPHPLYDHFKEKSKCGIFCSKIANLFLTNEEQSWMVFFKCHVYMHMKIWEKMLIVKQNTNNVCLQFVLQVRILNFTNTFFHFAFHFLPNFLHYKKLWCVIKTTVSSMHFCQRLR